MIAPFCSAVSGSPKATPTAMASTTSCDTMTGSFLILSSMVFSNCPESPDGSSCRPRGAPGLDRWLVSGEGPRASRECGSGAESVAGQRFDRRVVGVAARQPRVQHLVLGHAGNLLAGVGH